MINKRSAFVKVHEQIEVAVLACLSPCDRSEHRDPARSPELANSQDLRTAEAQVLQSQPTWETEADSILTSRILGTYRA